MYFREATFKGLCRLYIGVNKRHLKSLSWALIISLANKNICFMLKLIIGRIGTRDPQLSSRTEIYKHFPRAIACQCIINREVLTGSGNLSAPIIAKLGLASV